MSLSRERRSRGAEEQRSGGAGEAGGAEEEEYNFSDSLIISTYRVLLVSFPLYMGVDKIRARLTCHQWAVPMKKMTTLPCMKIQLFTSPCLRVPASIFKSVKVSQGIEKINDFWIIGFEL